jgi:hypothetical protein
MIKLTRDGDQDHNMRQDPQQFRATTLSELGFQVWS